MWNDQFRLSTIRSRRARKQKGRAGSGVSSRNKAFGRFESLESRIALTANTVEMLGQELELGSWLTADQVALAQSMADEITTTGDSTPVVFPATSQSYSVVGATSYYANAGYSAFDGSGSSMVVIDTGAKLDHTAFGPDADLNGISDRIAFQYDFSGANDANASDFSGHGTHVAGIAAGMAPGADIIILKVFPDGGGAASWQDIEEALQWVVANHAQYNVVSVNMSIQSGNYATETSVFAVSDELQFLDSILGIAQVASAGNSFYTYGSAQGVAYPAADAATIAVGATWDGNNGSASWSGGATDFTSGIDRVVSFSQRDDQLLDILAPGAFITSAGLSGGSSTQSGTSQAAPHITAAVAIAQQINQQLHGRRLSRSELVSLLQSTGVSVVDGDNEDDNVTNTGLTFKRLNVQSMAESLFAPVVESVSIWGANASDGVAGAYEIPTGSGQQIRSVPIGGANKVAIEFNTAIDPATMSGKLTLKNKLTGATISVGAPTASAGNTKFTWTLSSQLPPGAYRVTLAGTIRSSLWVLIDGEFATNPVSVGQTGTSVLPSGNGTPGGAFNFDFTYLSADSNRDNKVDGADLITWKNNFGGAGEVFITGDTDGDGDVDGIDFLTWQNQWGKNFTNLALANAEITSFATVAGVTIGGSGTTHASYSVPTGSGEQLRTIPIGGADTISLTFTADVSLVGDELLLYGADSGTHYGVVFEGYDALTYTATWRVASGVLPPEQLVIKLTDGVVDGSSTPLDGEWLNPAALSSSDDYLRDLSVTGAGDGLASGAFEFRVSILPGDFNLDNKVDQDDVNVQSINLGMPAGAVFTDGDFDGDGDVDGDDEDALYTVVAAALDYTTFADIVAPRVTSVWFDGSNSVHAPYQVPTGSGEQLRTVPMGGVDTIKLTFDEWVDLDGTELTAYGVTTGTTYSLNFVGYSYGVATWQLASGVFPAEQLLLRLDDVIVDAAGNALDGEFTNPWTLVDPAGSSTTLPSGDGVAGGDFRFRATILPSDFDRDNDVDSADGAIRTANNGSTTALHQHGDTDGDGDVDGSDFLKWQTQVGLNLTNWKSIEPGMILVSSAADEGDDSDYSIGDVTLREALARAYAQAGDDVIAFRDTLTGQTINLSLGHLAINSNVTLKGLGVDELTIDASASDPTPTVNNGDGIRPFAVSAGVTATIGGMRITGGDVVGGGGAVYVVGNLALRDVSVVNNSTTTHGGGAYVDPAGTMVVDSSTFDGNNAAGGGGAISGNFKPGLSLAISNSTLSNNTAGPAGGGAMLFYSSQGSTANLSMVNTTISGNVAPSAGGIQFQSYTGTSITASIRNSTITENTATTYSGGGIVNLNAATIILHNSIVAENTASNTTFHDVWGSVAGGGLSSYNLIGQVGGSGLTNGVNGNLVGTLTVRIDPLLGALADNGGPTKTHALLEGSLAIDAGNNDEADDLLFDQRRRARLVDGDDDGDLRVDIGAYEVEYDEFFASLGA